MPGRVPKKARQRGIAYRSLESEEIVEGSEVIRELFRRERELHAPGRGGGGERRGG
jgi:hypothetical protein